MNFHSDFVVGMESIIASVILVFVGIFLLIDDPFNKDNDLSHNRLEDAKNYIFDSNKGYAIIVCFTLFLIAIYGKETMQMKTTMLSSSLSRKIYEQMYPSLTWIMSLITYYAVSELYGEGWNKWSWMRLIGFIIVGIGCSLYMKALNKSKQIEKERKSQQKLLSDNDIHEQQVINYIDPIDNQINVDVNATNIQQA